MANFILVYDIDDHCEMGGGTFVEFYENIQEVELRVNELNEIEGKNGREFKIPYAASIKDQISFETVEKITMLRAIYK
jgi:hypothetical protein